MKMGLSLLHLGIYSGKTLCYDERNLIRKTRGPILAEIGR